MTTVIRRQWDTLGFAGKNYVANEEETMIYVLESYSQLDMKNGFGLSVSMELIAGWEYIDIDYSNKQGWASKESFISETHNEGFTFYPMVETLKEAIEEAGFKILPTFDESRIVKVLGGKRSEEQ